jgi:hypothetical protein
MGKWNKLICIHGVKEDVDEHACSECRKLTDELYGLAEPTRIFLKEPSLEQRVFYFATFPNVIDKDKTSDVIVKTVVIKTHCSDVIMNDIATLVSKYIENTGEYPKIIVMGKRQYERLIIGQDGMLKTVHVNGCNLDVYIVESAPMFVCGSPDVDYTKAKIKEIQENTT